MRNRQRAALQEVLAWHRGGASPSARKVTPEEYARIQTLAGEQPVSEWVRAALLRAAEDTPAADSIVLAELLALRAILLNVHFHLCNGTPLTAETMQRLIERADQDKREKAQARLAAADRSDP